MLARSNSTDILTNIRPTVHSERPLTARIASLFAPQRHDRHIHSPFTTSGLSKMSQPKPLGCLDHQHRQSHSPRTNSDLSKMSPPQRSKIKRLDLPHRHCLFPFLIGGSYSTYRKAQPHQFRFLDLPPELRNMVYDHTFAEGSRGLAPHPLTHVNRQIAQEIWR